MKKIISFILFLLLTVAGLSSCKNASDINSGEKGGKIKITTTIFPLYDWTKVVLGEQIKNAKISLLTEGGVDMHSYQPSADDIIKIADSDIFMHVGGESDTWVKDVLSQHKKDGRTEIDLLKTVGNDAKEEESKQGMQNESDDDEHGTDKEIDEHVWLSLRNAEKFVSEIARILGEKDPANANIYEKNANDYIEKLKGLDKAFEEAIKKSKTKTLLFGDRFPCRYFVNDYSLDYFAAFSGCSAETEASFDTIRFLSDKVDKLSLNAIIKLETSDGAIAKTIRDNTRTKTQKILTFDSMQSVTTEEISKGKTYFDVMKKNIEVVKTALK